VPLVPSTSPALQEALRHDARHAEAMDEIESRLAAAIAPGAPGRRAARRLADESCCTTSRRAAAIRRWPSCAGGAA
jgi:hypothetical protein